MAQEIQAQIKQAIRVVEANIDALIQQQQRLACQLVGGCQHEFIVPKTNNGQYPWSTDDHVICLNCRLSIPGTGCGVFHSPLLSFRASRIVSAKPGDNLTPLLSLSQEHLHALQFPRRFSHARLVEILRTTPYDADQALSLDAREYSILTEPFQTFEDWYRYTYRL